MDERINVLFPYFAVFSKGSYPWMTRKLNTLLQLDVATSRVRDHLKLLSGKLLTSKDVHNLRQVASSSDTTEDELLKVLENCIGNDPTCTGSLIINEDDELESYIQTSRMTSWTPSIAATTERCHSVLWWTWMEMVPDKSWLMPC